MWDSWWPEYFTGMSVRSRLRNMRPMNSFPPSQAGMDFRNMGRPRGAFATAVSRMRSKCSQGFSWKTTMSQSSMVRPAVSRQAPMAFTGNEGWPFTRVKRCSWAAARTFPSWTMAAEESWKKAERASS